ncbi:hypothetical protein LX32DRAFT_253240 [Colletotrichum zoysiae]|uniref:Uncharacterized protein n=1 Tax=Colletotrichum zoysiae TaxID=1216348 RepID=A0AAD9M9E8_9PEZI|nr:hypothetical protein LX32DRAFT_253240 [Colletotrichum zoysiae]
MVIVNLIERDPVLSPAARPRERHTRRNTLRRRLHYSPPGQSTRRRRRIRHRNGPMARETRLEREGGFRCRPLPPIESSGVGEGFTSPSTACRRKPRDCEALSLEARSDIWGSGFRRRHVRISGRSSTSRFRGFPLLSFLLLFSPSKLGRAEAVARERGGKSRRNRRSRRTDGRCWGCSQRGDAKNGRL